MIAPASHAPVALADPCELGALHCAIADAIKALVAWDITAFQFAVERQSAICDHLGGANLDRGLTPGTIQAAHKVQELNRVHNRLLQHSLHWTRTISSILQAGGHQSTSCASVHFRA